MAMPRSHRLISIERAVQSVGHHRVKPSVYFRPMAQPTSNSPATTSMTHAISHTPQLRVSAPSPMGGCTRPHFRSTAYRSGGIRNPLPQVAPQATSSPTRHGREGLSSLPMSELPASHLPSKARRG